MPDAPISAYADGLIPQSQDKFPIARLGGNDYLTYYELMNYGPALLYSTNYQVAGSISVPGSAEATPTDVMSITGWFDGSPLIFELSIWDVATGATLGNQVTFNLWEDGVDTGRRARFWTVANSANQGTIYRRWTHTPPLTNNLPTQHTYDIRAWGVGTTSLFSGPDPAAGASTPMEFNIYRAVAF